MSIEGKIRELLGESAVEPEVFTEEVLQAQKNIEMAIKKDHPDAKFEWNKDSWKAYVGGQEVSSGKYADRKEVKESSEEKSTEAKKEEITVDVSEDVAALVTGEELSEEFKEKAATIFEAAVLNRVKVEVAKLEEGFEQRVEEAVVEKYQGIVEQIDGYLDYIVEQWISENVIALESGIKSEILENFIGGLKGLFEEHYIDVPEEKHDLLGSLEENVEVLETKLEESVNENKELRAKLDGLERDSAISSVSEGLSALEVEKFKGLAEELAFDNIESYTNKLKTIKESYFTKTKNNTVIESVVTDTVITEDVSKKVNIDPTVSFFAKALDKNAK